MKHHFLFGCLFASLLFFACQKPELISYGEQSLDDAICLTKATWDQYESAIAWNEPIPANSRIRILLGEGGKEYELSPKDESWLIVADTNPMANSGPHYKWIFVSTTTSQISTYNTTSEPLFDNYRDIDEYLRHITTLKEPSPISSDAISASKSAMRTSLRPVDSPNKNWAIILSGGATPQSNYERYWNDCSYIYKTLTQNYQFPKSHVFTLISDGTDSGKDMRRLNGSIISSPTDLDEDGTPDIQYSAKKNNLRNVFSQLASSVQPDDNVFIFVIDHGGHDGLSSYICLWDGERLYPSELALFTAGITSDARIHFVLGQCYSGGFINSLAGNKRTITTACKEDESSFATTDGVYDEFVHHWTNAITGSYSGADINLDNIVSLHEAFFYAERHDIRSEHPLYKSVHESFGDHFDIGGAFIPTIIGSSDITSSFSSLFSLEDLPSGASVKWSLSINNLYSFYLGSGNSIDLSNDYSTLPYQPATLIATVTCGGQYTGKKYVNLWKPGIHFNSSLIIDHGDNYGGEYSLWTNPQGATGFHWETNDSNITLTQLGAYFVTYEIAQHGYTPDNPDIWVTFNNPFEETTIVVRTNN